MTSEEPLFDYSVVPTAVPRTTDSEHPVVVDLQLSVYNPFPEDQSDASLEFEIPPELTSTPGTITPSVAIGTEWVFDRSSGAPNKFVGDPMNPVTGLRGRQTIAFVLSGIRVVTVAGLAEIKVTEKTDLERTTTLGVTVSDSRLGITEFSADRVQVTPEDSLVKLAWRSTASACTVSGPHGTSPDLKSNDSYQVTPGVTSTYTLIGRAGGLSVTEQLTVNVARVQILSFGASPPQVAKGDQVDLGWLVLNAEHCSLWPGNVPVAHDGSPYRVTPETSTQYTLVVSGPGGTVAMPAPVEVPAVVVETFEAAPALVPPGGTLPSTLTWSTKWASDVAIDPAPTNPVGLKGSADVKPASTTKYTLTTTGEDPKVASATVTVGAALTFLKMQLLNGSLNLTWKATPDATIDCDGHPYPPDAGVALGSWPWALTKIQILNADKTCTGTVTITPPQDRRPPSFSLTAQCDYGINAPSANATLGWTVADGQTLSGTAVGAAPIQIDPSVSTVRFLTASPRNEDVWSLRVGFGADPKTWFGWTVA